ncbi:nucleotidyltransferase family protein [Microcystis aeruginosa CS-564/01]|nr:nucleotidyltransferase family protein [Microcystis aeruginosa]MDB9425132.1 nucleotidyltransferase family protein [Microcystis aeruginosa CS-564/01]
MSQIQTFHQQAMDLAEAAAVARLRGAIDLPTGKIADFCQRWQVTEFALFGSVLRDDFRPDSDIDIMVQFHPEAHPTFSSLDQMEAELKTMFHRDIDLITRQGIETSRNYLRRHEILSSAQVIYATGSSIPA